MGRHGVHLNQFQIAQIDSHLHGCRTGQNIDSVFFELLLIDIQQPPPDLGRMFRRNINFRLQIVFCRLTGYGVEHMPMGLTPRLNLLDRRARKIIRNPLLRIERLNLARLTILVQIGRVSLKRIGQRTVGHGAQPGFAVKLKFHLSQIQLSFLTGFPSIIIDFP